MACLAAMPVTGYDLQPDRTGEALRLRAYGQGEDYVDLLLSRGGAGILADNLREKTGPSADVPISPDLLSLGSVVEIVGRDIRRRPDGSVTVKLHIRTDDGLRFLTWDLSPAAARELAEECSR